MTEHAPFNVVIAGGGVAALEGALALRDLAGDLVTIQIVAPEPDFGYRSLAVREPFAHAPAPRYSLARFAEDVGAQLFTDEFAWVDAFRRTAYTKSGEGLRYDALLLALGAQMRKPFPHAVTIDDRRMDELLHGVIQDVEGGYTRRVAFVASAQMGWPLPLYELALMTAQRAYDMNLEVEVTIVTPETSPLAIFGVEASRVVAEILSEAGIATVTSAYAQVPESGRVVIHPGDRSLNVDRVIALPDLLGPAVRGVPAGRSGFIPVDPHGQVQGIPRIYAAGDATDFPVKHGGLASQQADAAAESIAALAGAGITPVIFRPEIRGTLLTGNRPRYLTAKITGGHGFSSTITEEPTWNPSAKVVSRYLAPYIEQLDGASMLAP
jgi:sulfide:quinone oxidoreductase